MKNKHLYTVLILPALLCSALFAGAQGMSINTTGSAADASAMLDVSSTTQGMLVPRMTAAQLAAIPTPATGLLVYQTDGSTGFYYNNGTPGVPSWLMISTPANISSTSLTLVALGENPGNNTASFYIAPGHGATAINTNNTDPMASPDAVFIMPFACTIAALQVASTTTVAGTGNDVTTFTLMKNGIAQSMTTSVTNTAAVGSPATGIDTTDTFAVAAGDVISIQFSETNNNGTSSPVINYSIILRTQ